MEEGAAGGSDATRGRALPLSVCGAGEGGWLPSVFTLAPSPAAKLSLRCSASPIALAGTSAAASEGPLPLGRPRPAPPPPPGTRAVPSPAARAAQCTMHRCWVAESRARIPVPASAPAAPLCKSPPPPHTDPRSPWQRPPAVASPIPLPNPLCLRLGLLSPRAALTHPAGPASGAVRMLARLRSPAQTGWRPGAPVRTLPCPGTAGTSCACSPPTIPEPEPLAPVPSRRCPPLPGRGREGRQPQPPLTWPGFVKGMDDQGSESRAWLIWGCVDGDSSGFLQTRGPGPRTSCPLLFRTCVD